MNLLIKLPFTMMNWTKLLALSLIFIIYGCGDAVENLEERAQIEKIESTSSIASITPAYGATAGGDTLTITGSNLDLVNSITLGDGSCTVATISSTVITCTTTAATAGSKNVIITNSKGKTSIYSNAFDYLAAPTVASITPAIGSASGGESVTITGTGFYQISDITINGVSCTTPITVSSTTATCTTGATTAGTYDVIVTNVDSQTGTLSSGYTYVNPPSIASFSPTTIIEAGGETLTITGSDFDGAATVTIDSFPCVVTFQDATTIDCTTDNYSGITGTGTDRFGPFGNDVTVVVTNSDGGSDSSTIDYVPAPIVSSIDIEYGALAGGDTITINGNYFESGGAFDVTMAGVSCATETVVDVNTITCLTDSNIAQTGDVVVTNFDGQQDSITNGFTYRPAPTVASVTVDNGPESGGTSVTISGTGFSTDGNISVYFDGAAATNVSVTNATTITCDTPSGSGTVDVMVTNIEDGQSGTGSGAFTYNPSPVISSITTPAFPYIDYGPLAGGNTIEIQGTNFFTGVAVEIDGNPCTPLTLVDVNTIECVAPAGTVGAKDVAVANTDGQSFTAVASYTYRSPPVLSVVDPIAGPIAGGQTITLNGNYIMADPTITVNGNPCTVTSLTGDNTVECTTPDNTGSGGAVNDVDIVITNQDGQTDNTSLVGAYDYIPAPTVTTSTPTSANSTGGSIITVTGSDFYVAGGINATIDGTDCLSISNLTATSFDCEVPPHVDADDLVIQVENLVDGQTGDSPAFFDYIGPPTLTDIYEATGTTIIDGGNDGGGYTIHLNGDNFQTGMTVDIGSANCTATIIDDNNATCAIPAAAYTAQAEDVVLTNLDTQTSTDTNAFTFRPAPTYSGVSPGYGAVAGGSNVTITGTNFISSVTAEIDGTPCDATSSVTSTSFICQVPAHIAATGLDIEVINMADLQTTGIQAGVFDYIPAPNITGIDLTSLWEVGGQTLTLTGTDLRPDAEVTIDGNVCTYVSDNGLNTEYVCTTPAGSGTGVTIAYTNVDGQSDTSNTIDYYEAPVILSYDYAFGPTTGGNTITITGDWVSNRA
jgi:hypothetical protein